jgi:hypothetical protein
VVVTRHGHKDSLGTKTRETAQAGAFGEPLQRYPGDYESLSVNFVFLNYNSNILSDIHATLGGVECPGPMSPRRGAGSAWLTNTRSMRRFVLEVCLRRVSLGQTRETSAIVFNNSFL